MIKVSSVVLSNIGSHSGMNVNFMVAHTLDTLAIFSLHKTAHDLSE